MGIESVLVGLDAGHVRVACAVSLADDADNDIGCDSVTVYVEDVAFALVAPDDSATAQLNALADIFRQVGHAIAVKLAEHDPDRASPICWLAAETEVTRAHVVGLDGCRVDPPYRVPADGYYTAVLDMVTGTAWIHPR